MEDCCNAPAFRGLFWNKCARAEEVEYLVPEANIRLRPIEKYPHGWGSRGHLSEAGVQWHAQLAALYCAISLHFLLWFSQVYVLLTHSVSSQPVLCHRTHGSAQQGSHIAVGLNHPPNIFLHRHTCGRRVLCCWFEIEVLFTNSVTFHANDTHSAHWTSNYLHCSNIGGHIFACIYLVTSLNADESVKTIEGYSHTQSSLMYEAIFLEPQPKWGECKVKTLDVKDQAFTSTICKLN